MHPATNIRMLLIDRVFSLQQGILNIQEKLEDLKYVLARGNFFSQRVFHLPFIETLRICCRVIADHHTRISLSAHESIKISPLWFDFIEICVDMIGAQVNGAVNLEANYFGDRNEDIMEIELSLVIGFLSWLVKQPYDASSTSIDFASFFGKFPFSESSNCDPMNEILSDSKGNITTKIFWLRSFRSSLVVPWTSFKKAFIDRFKLKNQSHALTAFEKLLTKASNNSHFPETLTPHTVDIDNEIEVKYISYYEITRLLQQYDESGRYSLFQMYQDLCDPQTSVVVMGQLMDHQIVNYPRPTLVKSLLGMKVTQISCGDQHMAVIIDPGIVYTWGKGFFGRLGHGDDSDIHEPQLVRRLHEYEQQHIVQVSCGFAFTGFVSESGRLYMCGAGMNGRLGLGTDENKSLPELVSGLNHEHVVKVQNGSVHSVILTKTGRVYSCGKADFTGHNNKVDVYVPMLVPTLSEIHVIDIAVGSGGFHTVVLSKEGLAYSWGHNRVGQLGIIADRTMPRNEDGGYYVPVPQQIKSHSPPVVGGIFAGWGHTCLLGDNGDVYVCGRNVENQLGLGGTGGRFVNERGHYYQPHMLRNQEGDLALVRVSQIACGGEHTLFHTSDYEMIGVGLNRSGQLGGASDLRPQNSHDHHHICQILRGDNDDHEDNIKFALPTVIPYFKREKRRILQMSCGFSCSMVLLGERTPSSLRAICSRQIRAISHLRDQVLVWQREREQLHSIDHALQGGEVSDSSAIAGRAEKVLKDELLTVQGCFLPEALYHDLDLARSVLLSPARGAPLPSLPTASSLSAVAVDEDAEAKIDVGNSNHQSHHNENFSLSEEEYMRETQWTVRSKVFDLLKIINEQN